MLELVIRAVDQASKVLNDVKKSTEDLGGEFDELNPALANASEEFKKLNAETLKGLQPTKEAEISWRDVGKALLAVTASLYVVKRAYEAIIVPVVEYADEVRRISDATGAATEDTARLLQVVGDFGVEANALEMAMRTMRNEGLVPSIDSLARLSNQFLSLAPGIERTDFLLKNFGYRGLDMADIMTRGGAAIRAYGEAVDAGLIPTQELMDATEDLTLAQEELSDAWLALSMTATTLLAPALTEMTLNLAGVGVASRTAAGGGEVLLEHLRSLSEEAEHGVGRVDSLGRAYGYAGEAAELLAAELRPLSDEWWNNRMAAQNAATQTERVNAAWEYALSLPGVISRQMFVTILTMLQQQSWFETEHQGESNIPAMGPSVVQFQGQTFRDAEWRGDQLYVRGQLYGTYPNRQHGGMLGGGWNLVGEGGPELISPSGAVVPAGRSAEMMGGGEAVLELRRMREELSRFTRELPVVLMDAVERLL